MTNGGGSVEPASIVWRTNWSTTVGNKLQEPSIVNVNTGASWATMGNEFYLEDYIDQSGGEFPKPQMQVVNNSDDPRTGQLITVKIKELDTVNNRIHFVFLDQTHTQLSGQALSELLNILSISVIINA